eukprot:m.184232 g.184232  ORF g.184232 m.184232 type:complete len:134 (+) comp17484_c2_seq5:152-553(+)
MARRAVEAGVAARLDRKSAAGFRTEDVSEAVTAAALARMRAAAAVLGRALRREHSLARSVQIVHDALLDGLPVHLLTPEVRHSLSWINVGGHDVMAVIMLLCLAGIVGGLFLICLPVRFYLGMKYDLEKMKDE